jgi:hypothetical protein
MWCMVFKVNGYFIGGLGLGILAIAISHQLEDQLLFFNAQAFLLRLMAIVAGSMSAIGLMFNDKMSLKFKSQLIQAARFCIIGCMSTSLSFVLVYLNG